MSDERPLRKQTRVQTKFLLGLAAILFFFSGLTSVTIYYYAKQTIEEEAYDKTELVMTAMAANRSYVREVLRPRMYDVLDDDTFVIEAMSSSYISRAVMERVNQTLKDFTYRRVAINARNPHYEANPIEAEMIQKFTNNPSMEEWHGLVEYNSERYFMRFKPEYFDSSCTYCHGDPKDAPQKIIDIYGDTRGFHRESGSVSGLISIGVPVDLSLSRIRESSIAIFMAGIPLILFLYGIISVFFNRFIVQNLHNILDIFRLTLKDEKNQALLVQPGSMDEIHELNDAAQTLAHYLKDNRQKLEEYTEQLLQGKELLQSVFDGITDPVVLLDNNARIKIVNAEFQKRNSVTLADVIHCSPLELKLNKCCPLQLCGDIFATMPDYPVTKEVKVATGEIFLIYFYPIQSTIGVVDNLICYVKDITEQKKLEIKIQQTEKLVSLGQLAAGIAHEINNPLGVILCHIDLLQDEGNLSDDAKADLAIIEKHAGNCRSIIADLLNFAHQQQTVKALGSIKTIITDVVTMVTPQFLKNHIEIVVKIDDELPLLYLDIDKIKQVILNLLINSSHAIGESGSIIISAAHDIKKSCCQIMIEDTGQGIPEEKIAKIFDPFFTTKPAGKGTGLGLSVSYGIINDHNGDIRAESEPGKNTCFIITLPTAEVTHE
jgi:signal transduction histidine kinase